MASEEERTSDSKEQAIVKDRLWLWSHDAGAHDEQWKLPKSSRITPVEAAFYLGVPNIIMVRYKGRPALPFDQYALPFRPLKQVVWSSVGAGGQTDESEWKTVLELAARHPNFTGLMMDDFFGSEEPAKNRKRAALSLEKLRKLRSLLSIGGRRLDLWAVLYEHQLDKPIGKYLELLDTVTFWTWDSRNLKLLKRNLLRLERVAPNSARLLGCYMWDYGKKRRMPLDRMQHQGEFGLELLQNGRIEGIIFLASCICDLELEAVEWTRNWIAQHGQLHVNSGKTYARRKPARLVP